MKTRKESSPIVRLKPTKENFAVMTDLFCACIETGTWPTPDSPAHCVARWLVADSGIKPDRRRVRLHKYRPKKIS